MRLAAQAYGFLYTTLVQTWCLIMIPLQHQVLTSQKKKKWIFQIWKRIIKKCYKGNTTSFCPVLGRLRRQFVIIADNYLRKWYLPLWAKQTGLRFLHPVLSQSLQHCTSRCPFDLSDGQRSRPCIIIWKLDFQCKRRTLNGFLILN